MPERSIEPPFNCPRCSGTGQIGGSGTGTLAAYCSTCGGTGRRAIEPPFDSRDEPYAAEAEAWERIEPPYRGRAVKPLGFWKKSGGC